MGEMPNHVEMSHRQAVVYVTSLVRQYRFPNSLIASMIAALNKGIDPLDVAQCAWLYIRHTVGYTAKPCV